MDNVPAEIIYEICEYLYDIDVINLSLTNKLLYDKLNGKIHEINVSIKYAKAIDDFGADYFNLWLHFTREHKQYRPGVHLVNNIDFRNCKINLNYNKSAILMHKY